MSTTTHPVAPEEIMAFLDGELSADRAQSLSSHLDQCAECREAAATFRNTSHSIAKWTVREVPVNAKFEERLEAAATKDGEPAGTLSSEIFRRTRLWTWKQWGVGLAGTAALAMLVFSIAVPNLLRSKMAANEASAIARRRAEETARAISVDNARTNASNERGLDAIRERLAEEKVSSQPENSNTSMYSAALPPPPPPSHVQHAERTLSQPMIARTVSLSVVVKDFDASRTALDAILARYNGYAAGLNVATPQGAARTLQASLRIPAPQLPAALAELKALGRVEIETQGGEEVTQQHADLLARLKNSRETEQRLQDVLRTSTGKVKDVLEVEEEIARVRGEIEQMEAEQKNLEHRVDFATIDLKLAEEYKAQLTTPSPSVATQLRNATIDGFRSAFQSFLTLVLFLAESGPSLLLWLMILSFPAWMLWRRYQRSLALGSSLGV